MVYRGKVHNGTIVLEKGVKLEEGLTVSVRPVRPRGARDPRKKGPQSTFYERYREFIGAAKGLPADFSQHDRYLRRLSGGK
jgi:hypothetical protein